MRISPCSNSRRRARRRGLALIETLAALVILGLTLVLATGTLQAGQDGARLQRGAAAIRAAMTAAQAHALVHGGQGRVELFVKESFFYTDDGAYDLPPGVIVEQVTLIDQSLEDGIGVILFSADGGSSGGAVTLRSDQGGRLRLQVDWLTGRIRTERL